MMCNIRLDLMVGEVWYLMYCSLFEGITPWSLSNFD